MKSKNIREFLRMNPQGDANFLIWESIPHFLENFWKICWYKYYKKLFLWRSYWTTTDGIILSKSKKSGTTHQYIFDKNHHIKQNLENEIMTMHTSEEKWSSSLSSKLLAMQNDDVCKTIKYSQNFLNLYNMVCVKFYCLRNFKVYIK